MQLAVSLAVKKPFLKRFQPEKSRRVLFINGEDDKNEVHRRLKNIVAVSLDDLSPKKAAKAKKNLKKRLKDETLLAVDSSILFGLVCRIEVFRNDKGYLEVKAIPFKKSNDNSAD